jgi:ABC-type nitrate/sulfonate/bicarbonate transport system substrate-binding protein
LTILYHVDSVRSVSAGHGHRPANEIQLMIEGSPMPDTTLAVSLDQLWFTRCPVPTATGLAYKLGWLTREFADDGITISTLQDAPRELGLGRHHYDHQLPSLIREGGNVLAIPARAQGAPTRLVGLTWIEEWQSILVRPDSGISEAKDLEGKRLALPSYVENPIAEHVRGTSIARAMSLHGYKGALAYAGLTFDDVEFVEVCNGSGWGPARSIPRTQDSIDGLWDVQALANGKVDAVYVKGASAVDAARRAGVVVGIDLDRIPNPWFRVNNGTPRPITVHEDLLENHFDLVVRFLEQTLRAADWAADNLDDVLDVLQTETFGSREAVAAAYRDGFHKSLHPDLSDDRVNLFEQQKKFLWLHGFSDRDFSLDAWIDRRPLEAAVKLRAERKARGL